MTSFLDSWRSFDRAFLLPVSPVIKSLIYAAEDNLFKMQILLCYLVDKFILCLISLTLFHCL